MYTWRSALQLLSILAGALALACGQSAPSGGGLVTSPTVTSAPTPSAAEILVKPESSTMRDMHFTATVDATSGGQKAELTGEGDMVVRPYSAFHMKVQGSDGGTSVSEEIITKDGMDYVRQGNQKFQVSASTQASDVNTWQDATDASLVGEEELPTGNAWHVKATSKGGNHFEAWVRKSDGYLLRYFATSRSGNTTFIYSMIEFNTGVGIAAPPQSQVA